MGGDDPKTVVLVGHCRPDFYMLKLAVEGAVPAVRVEGANTDDALAALAGSADLLLVNRVLDGRFASTRGLDLVERFASEGGPRTMLISNFEDAQQDAQAAGALPGFGKSDMRSERAVARLRSALGV